MRLGLGTGIRSETNLLNYLAQKRITLAMAAPGYGGWKEYPIGTAWLL